MAGVMMKGLNLNFILPVLALLGAIIWIGYVVVAKNPASKEIVFSYTALISTFLMFALNIGFSLKNESSEEVIQPHIVLSGGIVDLFSAKSGKSAFVIHNREELSKSLGFPSYQTENEIPASIKTPEKRAEFYNLLVEYLRISVIGEWLDSYPDWDSKVEVFRGRRQEQVNYSLERNGNNSYFTIAEIEKKLDITNFKFSNRVGLSKGLILPPETILYTSGNDIVLDNPFATITISFNIANGMSRGDPLSWYKLVIPDREKAHLDPVNIQSNIVFDILRKKQRSGSREFEKYSKWMERVFKTIESGLVPTNA